MRRRGLACAALLSLSCLREDPNHCANRDGDATCRGLGGGEFCSVCGSKNAGCVDERPDDACHYEGSAPSSGTTTDVGTEASPTSEAESSSGGPPPECEAGSDCPDDRPYCIAGACGTCDLADAGFCAELDPATPACHPQWGRCVKCTPDDASACTGKNAWCGLDFTCGGCTEHAQCPNSACDLETGDCLDDSIVVHVDNTVCPEAGSGTEAMPYCSIATAFTQVDSGEKGTVFLHGTTTPYDEGLILTANPQRSIAVIGIGSPAVIVAGAGFAASVGNYNKLYVSNVRLSSPVGSAVQCLGQDARVWLDDLLIHNNVDGVVVDRCRARVRRVRIVDNDGYGVVLTTAADLRLWSSVIANSGDVEGTTAGLYVDASTIDVRYSTIANNDSTLSGENVFCVAKGGGTIRNSVVVAPGLESLVCPWATTSFTVHDNAVLGGNTNSNVETFNPEWFRDVEASDFHVGDLGPNLFGDRAQWELGDPILDLDSDARPAYPGASGFVGADQP